MEEARSQIGLQSEKVMAQRQHVQRLSRELEMAEKELETLQQNETSLYARYVEVQLKNKNKNKLAIVSITFR